MDKYKKLRVSCMGGLATNEDTLVLGKDFPGMAERLVNYEVSQRGGYRRIEGFSVYDGSAAAVPGTGATLGCWVFGNTIHAARAVSTGSTYEIRRYVTGSGWTTAALNVLTTGTPDTRSAVGVSRVRIIRHNFEGLNKYTLLDGVNFPATYTSAGTWTVLTSADSSGNAVDVQGASYARDFKNHMAYAGMPGSKSHLVVISAPNDHDDFTNGSGTLSVSAGFEVRGLAVFRDDLYIFGEDEIKKITGNNSSDFQLVDVTKNIGIVSPDSILEVGGDIVYWSQDGIRLISGTDKIGDVNLETISENIKATLIDYPDIYDMNNVVGVTVRKKTQVRFFIYDSTQLASESVGLIGGKRFAPGGNRGSMWEWGDLLGIQANCADSGFINGKEVVIHGDANGFVYRQENGDTSFGGNEILSVYSTPYLDMGDTETHKDFHRYHVFFRAEGRFQLSLGRSVAWDDPDYEIPVNRDLIVSTLSAVYNDITVKYDDTAILWDGAGRASRRINIGSSGPSIRFVLVGSSATDAPHSIQGFVVRYIELGEHST